MNKVIQTNSKELSAFCTAYFDLLGIISLLQSNGNQKYSAVPIHSIGKDICLILYQINKDIFNSSYKLNTEIKKIRHKVKLSSSNNQKMHEEILEFHVQKYGDDVNNLGFYLGDGSLKGSTLYPTYLFYDTTLFKSENINNAIFSFFRNVGETSIQFLLHISNLTEGRLPFTVPASIVLADNQRFIEKDIHHTSLFTGDRKTDSFITRLLLIQQELVTCEWLKTNVISERKLNMRNSGYILLRLLSMKIDQVMDNLENIKRFLPEHYSEVNAKSSGRLECILEAYRMSISEECRVLRNLLHYDVNGINFYGFLAQRTGRNENYINLMVDKIVLDFVTPLSDMLSDYFNIVNLKSMGDLEMILNRLKNMLS
ncbi:hypothetical protein [Paenibacillus sp. NPDC058177]|uniref:hypothetical protein n=1 Tax=Paenibacillus sp. NPDC058177 TaxID=3346369 RepID=UPI0036DA4763